ncbi:hypothetical protein SK803_18430 [Lentzea sp. BCCO 10_0856]|uniref:Lipoprotein LpqN n=1 Tax=Lentzea miocenica TaxID=3095431 RepID=A0ABU4T275_9PSEU|nr:hypothetical protein [Lentzea sp. BCCO 10_0856]MDX8032200.1 hypothetical protein [Lentzea sp. BCCO 10_0856]
MNRSLVLITAAAALALTACTSTPTPDNTATSTSASPTTPQAAVVTEVVTHTVTNPPAAPVKPVIGSFGYGDLKLGMTRQQALDARLIGPDLPGPGPADACSVHEIVGTGQKVQVSKKLGVASIVFTPEMASDGVGIGATEATLKAEYTNLRPTGPNYSYRAVADNNPAAEFIFRVAEGKVTMAILLLDNQDCHN